MSDPTTRHAAGHAVLLEALGHQEEELRRQLAELTRLRVHRTLEHLDELHGGSRALEDLREHGMAGGASPAPLPPDELEALGELPLARVTHAELEEAQEVRRSLEIQRHEAEAEMYAGLLAAGYGAAHALDLLDQEQTS